MKTRQEPHKWSEVRALGAGGVGGELQEGSGARGQRIEGLGCRAQEGSGVSRKVRGLAP